MGAQAKHGYRSRGREGIISDRFLRHPAFQRDAIWLCGHGSRKQASKQDAGHPHVQRAAAHQSSTHTNSTSTQARREGSTNRPLPRGSSSRPMVARPVRYGPVRQKTNFPMPPTRGPLLLYQVWPVWSDGVSPFFRVSVTQSVTPQGLKRSAPCSARCGAVAVVQVRGSGLKVYSTDQPRLAAAVSQP